MCAAANDKPTTAAEKNSFERNPRSVSTFPSWSCFGCDSRYNGSAAGSTRIVIAVATEISTA